MHLFPGNRLPVNRRQQAYRGIQIGLGAAALVLLLWAGNFFAQTRLRLSNIYFVPTRTTDSIVIVALDNTSLAAYGRAPVQWERRLYADLVRRLAQAQARVIAFDIIFAEATLDDELLLQALQDVRASDVRTRVIMPIAGTNPLEVNQRESERAITFQNVLKPASAFLNVDNLGYINTFPDVDGTVRRQPTWVQAEDQRGLSFSLATYLAYLRIPTAAIPEIVKSQGDTLTIANNLVIPVDERGIWMQNFFGPSSEGSLKTFPVVSFHAVLNGKVDMTLFADKIVLIGLMSNIGVTDRYPVPSDSFGRMMNGVEIQANAIETLLQRIPLREQSGASQALTIILLALASSLIFTQLRWYWMIPMALALGVGWVVFASVVFHTWHHVLNLFHPLLTIAVALAAAVGVQIITEVNRRRQTELLYTETRRQYELLDAVLNGSPAGIIVADASLKLLKTNRTLDDALGVTSADYIGQPLSRMLDAVDVADETRARLDRLFHDNQHFREQLRVGGNVFYVDAALLPDIGEWVVTLSDVSALAELSDLKTRMIRMASHDLKNPLALVIGYSKLILELDNPMLPKDVRDYIVRIARAGDDMNVLISDILNLEQLRSGGLKHEEVNFTALVDEAIDSNRDSMVLKNQRFTSALPDDLPMVIGDHRKLVQVVSNILNNAVKYTPEGGSIALRVFPIENVIRLEVEDTGYGIPEAAQQRLFEEFYRVRTKATAHISGTGLGLSLVKSIVEAHHGRIWFQSKEGVGSTFFVEIPCAP